MENNSTISNNSAITCGGVYFDCSYCNIISSDKTATISNNVARAGEAGAVKFKKCAGTTEGELNGITFKNNSTQLEGGALFIQQKYVRVINCTFTSNTAAHTGGAAFVGDNAGEGGFYNCTITGNNASREGGAFYLKSHNYLENCTITGNYCGGAYEGGGVFVYYDYDVSVKGKLVVKNNTRGSSGSADDLFLSAGGYGSSAYIKGSVDADSSIGIRTNVTGDRLVAKEVSTYADGNYFMDLDGYYVTHGTDHDGDVWQRKGETQFSVKLNGTLVGNFKPDVKVALNGASTDDGKVFWRWSEQSSTGLAPFNDYVTDIYSPTLTFFMPQNNVDLVADYVPYADDFKVTIARPVAGESLPTTATLSYTSAGVAKTATIGNIRWKDSTGATATTAAYDAKYRFDFSLADDKGAGLAFSSDIDNTKVEIACTDGGAGVGVQYAGRDGSSYLKLTSAYFKTALPEVESVEGASIKVTAGTAKDALEALLPGTAKANVQGGTTVELEIDDTTSISWPSGLINGDDVVADPAGDSQDYTLHLPLKDSDKVAGADGKELVVTITVLPKERVADPVLNLISGTYTKFNETMRLGEDNTLTVKASCATDGASIKYTVNGGETKDYDPNAGIVLTCPQDDSEFYELSVWAVRGEVESDKVPGSYHLDDTLQKTIQIGCTDTALYGEGDTRWSATIDVTADLGATTTATAPEQTGRVFSHWVWDESLNDKCSVDSTQTTITIEDFSSAYAGKIFAVYTPVISKIDVGFDAPQAHRPLSAAASCVQIGTADAETMLDVTSYFKDKTEAGVALSWLPTGSGDDGEAVHLTSYTASLPLNLSLPEGVSYKLADSVEVSLNEVGLDKSLAYVAKDSDGTQKLYVNFASTGPYEYKSYTQPSDVEMTFLDACTYQQEQDDGKSPDWDLPSEMEVTYVCGETDLVDISWQAPQGFDKDNPTAQHIVVKGTVSYPSYVDDSDAPETVELKIHIAAPELVSEPTSNPAPGTYTEALSVDLVCETQGATIYYTTDGTDPDETSSKYEGDPLKISTTTTVKARAYRAGMRASGISTFAYTIEAEPTPTPTPEPALVYVTFDSQGGSDVATACISSGEKCPKPEADPTKAGCTFAGWYTDAACSEGKEFAFDDEGMSEAALSVDTTLYAKWTSVTPAPAPAATYTVSFETNGGSAVADITAEAGSTIEKPEDPTRDGFTFAGWYTDEDCTEAWDWDSDVVTGDTVLYAKWTEAAADDDDDADDDDSADEAPADEGEADSAADDDENAVNATYGETKSVDDSDASANKTADTGDELANSPLMTALTALGLAALAGCVASALYTRRRLREEER